MTKSGDDWSLADGKPADDEAPRVNIWQGVFPHDNTVADGFERTAPVGSFEANAS